MRFSTSVIVALLAGCAAAPNPKTAPILQNEATRVLDAQVARWNQGDLAGFVDTYWDGPEMTFWSSRGVRRGRAELLAGYQTGYATPEKRGVLSFEVVDFQPLGNDHALLLGRYHIARQDPADGYFSLVLARQNGKVTILHDHTTEAPPK